MAHDDITLTPFEYRLIEAGEYGDLTPEDVLDLKRRFIAAGGVYPAQWGNE